MNVYQKFEAESLINSFGKKKRPFFFLIDFEMQAIQVYPLDELPSDIYYAYDANTNVSKLDNNFHTPTITQKYPLDICEYEAAFDQVMREIRYGNTFLINLTFGTPIQLSGDLIDVFKASTARYRLLYKDQFVVFSPEIFIRITAGQISTYPMKGTIDANIPDAMRKLLLDEKEKAEHATIVDLLRNDLSIHATEVRVARYKYLDLIKTQDKSLYQMSSKITGKLPEGYESHLGTILFSMLPAGSVSGAPKPKTVEIIKAAENGKRGYYTGVSGVFDGRDLDSAVLIRYIEKVGNQYWYRSGCGITHQSIMENEYHEMIDKIYVPTI